MSVSPVINSSSFAPASKCRKELSPLNSSSFLSARGGVRAPRLLPISCACEIRGLKNSLIGRTRSFAHRQPGAMSCFTVALVALVFATSPYGVLSAHTTQNGKLERPCLTSTFRADDANILPTSIDPMLIQARLPQLQTKAEVPYSASSRSYVVYLCFVVLLRS